MVDPSDSPPQHTFMPRPHLLTQTPAFPQDSQGTRPAPPLGTPQAGLGSRRPEGTQGAHPHPHPHPHPAAQRRPPPMAAMLWGGRGRSRPKRGCHQRGPPRLPLLAPSPSRADHSAASAASVGSAKNAPPRSRARMGEAATLDRGSPGNVVPASLAQRSCCSRSASWEL